MGYDKLLEKISILKSIDPDMVIEKSLGSQKLFFLNPEKFSHADVSLKVHVRCNKENEKIIDSIVKEMKSDIYFRNFICVNFQSFLQDSKDDYSMFIQTEEDIPEGELKELFRVRLFGFIDTKNKVELDDKNKENMFVSLTEYYLNDLSYLNGKKGDTTNMDFKENIKKPLEKLIKILEIKGEFIVADNENYIELNAEFKTLQDFLFGLQFHIFYEHYINSIIRDKTGIDVIQNPVIFVNPSYMEDRKTVHGYIELDGCIYITKKNTLFFVECKNSHQIELKYVTQFIGKCRFLEKIYNIEIQKCLVSTGSLKPFFYKWYEFKSFSDIGLFGKPDHILNHKYLLKFIEKSFR